MIELDPHDLASLREAAALTGRRAESFAAEELMSLAHAILARGGVDGVTLARDRVSERAAFCKICHSADVVHAAANEWALREAQAETRPAGPSLADTRAWVARLHEGQADKAGVPYMRHVERVAAIHARLFPEASPAERHAAWLHDAIEDTDATAEILAARGYSAETIAIVEAVTKPVDGRSTYAQRIDGLIARGLAGAVRVKIADLTDNLDEDRLAHLPPEFAAAARRRYSHARARLLAALDHLTAHG